MVLLAAVLLAGGATAVTAGSCARHDQSSLTRAYVLDFAYTVDQVVGQRYDVSLQPADAAAFERIFNRIYQCKPGLLDPQQNDYAGVHERLQFIVNSFHQQACYFTLDRKVAGIMVVLMRMLHECFPE